jgi:hypothetical protein
MRPMYGARRPFHSHRPSKALPHSAKSRSVEGFEPFILELQQRIIDDAETLEREVSPSQPAVFAMDRCISGAANMKASSRRCVPYPTMQHQLAECCTFITRPRLWACALSTGSLCRIRQPPA